MQNANAMINCGHHREEKPRHLGEHQMTHPWTSNCTLPMTGATTSVANHDSISWLPKNTSIIFTPLDVFPRDFKHLIDMQCSPKLLQIATNEFQNSFQQMRHPTQKSSGDGEHDCKPCSCSKCRKSILRPIPGLSSSLYRKHHAQTKGIETASNSDVNPLLDLKSFRHSKGGRKRTEFQFEYSKLHHTTRWETLQSSWRSDAVPCPSFTSCDKFRNQKYRSKVCLETLSHGTFARWSSLAKMMPQSKDHENRQSSSRFPWSKCFPYSCEVKSFQLFGK